jgi:hypothetical protein
VARRDPLRVHESARIARPPDHESLQRLLLAATHHGGGPFEPALDARSATAFPRTACAVPHARVRRVVQNVSRDVECVECGSGRRRVPAMPPSCARAGSSVRSGANTPRSDRSGRGVT